MIVSYVFLKNYSVYLGGIYGTYVYFYTEITFIVTQYHFFR